MATDTAITLESANYAMVDPRSPRFGQTVTALGLVAGIAFQQPIFVFAIATVLVVSAVSGWRLDLYGFVWRTVMIPIVGEPATKEPAAPHRFAKLLGAGFTTLASLLLLATLAGAPATLAVGGYALAGIVGVLAIVAAAFDYCLGCKMYRQVSFFRRLGWV